MRSPASPWAAACAASKPAAQASVLAAWRRRNDAVACANAQLRCSATGDFDDHDDRLARRNETLVQRLCRRDPGDGVIRADEDDVERNESVLHPEGYLLRRAVREDHSLVRAKRSPKHQPPLLLGRSSGLLHDE